LRAAIEPFQFGYVLDEVARVLDLPGDGRISLLVRGGYVVGTEVTRFPSDDPEIRRILSFRSKNPLFARVIGPDGSSKPPKKTLQ
jgi:hypothetical protein